MDFSGGEAPRWDEAVGDGPRQQLVDPVDRVVRNAFEHVAQVRLRVKAVQFGRADQRVERGSALATGIGAGEQPVLAADRQSPDILPISGRKSQSTTGGILCTAARSGGSTASNALAGSSFT